LKELEAGIRISSEGILFVGLDEVNAAINHGAKVIAIKEGNAFMRKVKEDDESTRLSFSGFSITVVIEE
jgi:uncharacterized protein with PhoU and TrkA domain